MVTRIAWVAILLSVYVGRASARSNDTLSIVESVLHVLQHEVPSNNAYKVLYFIANGFCVDCESEARFAWKSLPGFMRARVAPVVVSDGLVDDSQMQYGWPVVRVPEIRGMQFVQGRIALVGPDNRLLLFYKAGSKDGYEHAYRIVDSALFEQELTQPMAPSSSSVLCKIDSIGPLLEPYWSRTRLGYDWRTKQASVLVLERAKYAEYDLTDHSLRAERLPAYQAIQKDTLIRILYYMRSDGFPVWSVMKCAGPVDTFVYGRHVESFRSIWQEVNASRVGNANVGFRFSKVFGAFAIGSPGGRFLWILDDRSEHLHNPTPLRYSVFDDKAGRQAEVATDLNLPYSSPQFTACYPEKLVIAPDSGVMIILGIDGSQTYRNLSLHLPGKRLLTLADADSTLIAVQQIAGKRYALRYSIDGIRLSRPTVLSDDMIPLAFESDNSLLVFQNQNAQVVFKRLVY